MNATIRFVSRHRKSTCLLIVLFAGVVFVQINPVIGQGTVRLPTRFGIEDRAPDFTIFEDLDLNGATFHSVVTGDFNGDGISDVLITNTLALGSSSRAGKAYVILGGRSLGLQKSVNLSREEPDLTILGSAGGSQLGISATTGDVNGDKIDDIVLSATSVRAPGGRLTGAIYVIFGSRVFNSHIIDLAHTPADVTIFGKVSESLGLGLAVGDVNGDGAKDLIFRQSPEFAFPTSAPDRTRFAKDLTLKQSVTEAETVSILLGPFTTNTTFDLSATSTDIVINRGSLPGLFGFAIAAADVNGDGTADLVIGTPILGRPDSAGPGIAGVADIIMGSPALKRGVTISLSQTPSNATILGAAGDGLGRVIAIGDVNGDGINDIILSAPDASRLGNGLGPTSAGVTYVVFGSLVLAGRFIDAGLGQQDLTIQGTAATAEANSIEFGDRLGISIVATDVDGDGVTDLLIGAPGAGGVKDFGEAYVVLGSSELITGGVIKTSEGDQDITISGQEKQAHLGTLVASGDLNGDGISDLILEADNAETPGGSQQGTGAIYIYFGAKVRAPEITKAKFKEGKSQLQITGSEFTGDVRVEINGVTINREVSFLPEDGRLILKGTRQELNLNSNPNQVVILRKGTRSNVARVKGS